jgi:hypothetical protein
MPLIAAVITNCTQRKALPVHDRLSCLPAARGLQPLARTWKRLVAEAPPAGIAASLYQGRSISEIEAVAAHLSTRWYVVSAGLGLVASEQWIPSYECSVTAGSELSNRLQRMQLSAHHWWEALTASEPNPLSRLIARGPTLLALPSTYIRLVCQDLCRVTPRQAQHLRIFTATAGVNCVPSNLSACVMPYDDRLESVPSYAGTRIDFAQRALKHFVVALDATSLPIEQARRQVQSALSRRPRPIRRVGVRLSDDELRATLKESWVRHEGRSTRLLRYLRDEAGISCEQKRFCRIWQSLAAEMHG